MNGRPEINKDDLLDTLERITPIEFARLVFQLEVPKNLMPAEDKEATLRAISLLEWAKAPGGCGLERIQQALEERGILLDKINLPKKDFNEICRITQVRLFNFDHKTTLGTFKEIVEKMATQENAGIFILPKCFSQGGSYCPQRLINYLKDPSVTAQGKFHLKNVNYLRGERTLKGLLCRLAGELKIEQNLEKLTESNLISIIVNKIHHSIPINDAGNTYFFHVKGYDSLLRDETFWKSFIEDFWNILINDLPSIVDKHRRLKLIFLFESMIDIKVKPDNICSFPQTFSRKKIVELPLKPCEIEEIEAWLCDCSKLPLNIIDNILDILKIADDRDRQPDRVYKYLEDELIQYLQNV